MFNTWRPEAPLNMKRIQHACGVLLTDIDVKIVVVAGGINSQGSRVDNVETLKVSGNDTVFAQEWKSGPKLPWPLSDAAGATTIDQHAFYIFGGTISSIENSVYIFNMRCFDDDLDCHWTKVELELRSSSTKGLLLVMPSIPMVAIDYDNAQDCPNGTLSNININ